MPGPISEEPDMPWIASSFALLVSLALHSACPAAPTPDDDRKTLEPVIAALEFLQQDFRIVGEGGLIAFEVPTKRFGYERGSLKLSLIVQPFTLGEGKMQWFQLTAPSIHSLNDCAHPDAARRAILESGEMLGTDVQFTYDGIVGSVDARVAIPAVDGKVPAALLKAYCGIIVNAVDQLAPVIGRAMESGFIDWEVRDQGPKKPEGELKVPVDGGEPLTVSWAPWIEPNIYASTILTSDALWRRFSRMDDEQREQLGRQIASLGGSSGRSTYAAWMRISDHMEQHFPPLAFRFWGPPGTKVSATASIEGFCAPTTASGTIDGMWKWDVDLAPEWDLETLAAVKERRQVEVRYTVECGGQRASGVQVVVIQPSSVADLGLGFLATPQYVNEDHPWVRSVISEAVALGIADSMGYTGQEGHADCVRQIFAVWSAFRNRGISYVSIPNSSASGASQAIRKFDEAISDKGANCADGSAAFASVLRRLGFDVWLVHPKNHVFVAVRLPSCPEDKQWVFVETTMLGDVAIEPPGADAPFSDVAARIPERLRGENWATFVEACAKGQDEASSDETREWICIESARERLKMVPIPALSRAVGAIPPIPPAADLERTRAGFREAEQKRAARFKALTRVDAPACKPYDSLEQVRGDIDAIERDPEALRRLLAAVAGESLAARFARVAAEHQARLLPALSAGARKFGSLPLRGRDTLGVVGSPWEIDVERQKGKAHIVIRPRDRQSNESWVDAAESGGSWTVTDDSLVDDVAWLLLTAKLHAGERGQPDGLSKLAARLADQVNAGEFQSPGPFLQALAKGLEGLCPSEAELDRIAAGVPSEAAVGNVRVVAGDAPANPVPAAASVTGREAGPGKTAAQRPKLSDEIVGSGAAAEGGDKVVFIYRLLLDDGKVVFDTRASRDGKRTREWVAGTGNPPGLGLALVGVRAGGRRVAVIPPELGWGDKGHKDSGIPPGATLRYEIDVLQVIPAGR